MSRYFNSSLETRKRILIWLHDIWQGKQSLRLPEAAHSFPFASVDIPFARAHWRGGRLSVDFWCRIVFAEHRTDSTQPARYDWTLYISEFSKVPSSSPSRATKMYIFRG